MTARKKPLSFEEGMKALEQLTARLAEEELPLEEAISLYEQGVKLHAQLEGTLAAQQKRIERIDPETADMAAFEGNEHDVS